MARHEVEKLTEQYSRMISEYQQSVERVMPYCGEREALRRAEDKADCRARRRERERELEQKLRDYDLSVGTMKHRLLQINCSSSKLRMKSSN